MLVVNRLIRASIEPDPQFQTTGHTRRALSVATKNLAMCLGVRSTALPPPYGLVVGVVMAGRKGRGTRADYCGQTGRLFGPYRKNPETWRVGITAKSQ